MECTEWDWRRQAKRQCRGADTFRKALPRFDTRNLSQFHRESLPEEYRFGHEPKAMKSPPSMVDESLPYSLSSFHTHPFVIVGLHDGTAEVIRTSDLSQKSYRYPAVELGALEYTHDLPDTILDINVATDDSSILAATSRGAYLWDATRGSTTDHFSKFTENRGSPIRVQHSKYHNSIASVALSSGSICILDKRAGDYAVAEIQWPHAVRKGPVAHRRYPRTTALAWVEESMLASGSDDNQSIKFWDLRKSRKQVQVTNPPNTGVGSNFGINNIIHDEELDCIWALGRDSTVFSCTKLSPEAGTCLAASTLQIRNSFARLALIERGNSFSVPFLACGGIQCVTMISRPSPLAHLKGYDATRATLLPSPADITGVVWQPYSQELVAIADDRSTRFWSPSYKHFAYLEHQGLRPKSSESYSLAIGRKNI